MDPQRFDPAKLGERSRKAYQALMYDDEIWDDKWHPWPAVIAKMMARSDLAAKSCCDILRGMEWSGELLRRGKYSTKGDHREARFIDLDYLSPANFDRSNYPDEEWAEMLGKIESVKKLHRLARSQAQERFRGTV